MSWSSGERVRNLAATEKFAFCLLLLKFIVNAHANECPVVGTNQTMKQTRSTRERLFMNFESPAQCKGNVTGWHFCYYRNIDDDFDDIDDRVTVEARFLVYRRENPTSNIYVAVSRSLIYEGLPWSTVQLSAFSCMEITLSLEEQFEIQENDVVGACIQDALRTNNQPLLLVGTNSDLNLKTYQFDRFGYESCLPILLENVSTNRSDFTLRATSILHLQAVIETETTCTAGNRPPSVAPLTPLLGGTFLNTQYPVTSCGNYITKWHYCYYTEAATPGSTLSMTVAVWSLDTDTNTYIVSPSSIRNITIQPVQTLAKIFCVEEVLNEIEYVSVSPGSIIGAILPSNNAIPVISSSSDHSMASIEGHSQNGSPEDIPISELSRLSNAALHLHANLEYRDDPGTLFRPTSLPEGLQTTSTTSMMTSSTNQQSEMTSEQILYTSESLDNSSVGITELVTTTVNTQQETTDTLLVVADDIEDGFARGNIAAIIISMTIILGLLGIVTVLIVLILYRRRSMYVTQNSGLDNMTYSLTDNSTKGDSVQVYDSIAEPQIYSEIETSFQPDVESGRVTSPHYDNNYIVMDSAYEYQQELEHIKKGSSVNKPECVYTNPGKNEREVYAFLKQRRINNIHGSSLKIGGLLGSGQFGVVYQGEWIESPTLTLQVALKSLKNGAKTDEKLKFLQEGATMAQFRHSNVAALYGVSEKDGTTFLVVELLSRGDLRQYLHTLVPDPGELMPASVPNLLLQFSRQICLGMNYLTNTGFIHRDLAARNVLISDSLICKIADFGMSRNLHEGDYYTSSGGKIPIKWTAPEAIHYNKYSTASDVWSYGCILYEIWSLGHKPFEKTDNVKVIRIVDTGTRLAPPPGCPRIIYEVMMMCWSPNPRERPGFRDILLSILENECVVLHIPADVTDSHPQAATLGAPLQAGYQMYSDIHNKYLLN